MINKEFEDFLHTAKVIKLEGTGDFYVFFVEVSYFLAAEKVAENLKNIRETIKELAPDLKFIITTMYSGNKFFDVESYKTLLATTEVKNEDKSEKV